MPRRHIRRWPRSRGTLWTELPRSHWREVRRRSPYLATRRFWFWEGRAMRQRSRVKTVSSAGWDGGGGFWVGGGGGYEGGVEGKFGFVGGGGGGWGAAFDWAEFWNPKVRAA